MPFTSADVDKFRIACQITVRECTDEYARSYAYAGLSLTGEDYIRTQCLYILNNMGHWRGETARQCRTVFKELSPKRSKR